jgi:electron transport complex protein RnfG
MTTETQTMPAPTPDTSSLRLLLTLGCAATLSGVLISLVFQLTLPRIQENQRRAVEAAVFEVLPGAETRGTFSFDAAEVLAAIDEQADTASSKIYAGYDSGGDLIGVALEAKGQGYQDVVRILYGYDPKRQVIVGMKLMESKETPGLGDKIGKDPEFLANFEALDVQLDSTTDALANPLEVTKKGAKSELWHIDGITGATISSRAVGDMLNVYADRDFARIRANVQVLEGGAP